MFRSIVSSFRRSRLGRQLGLTAVVLPSAILSTGSSRAQHAQEVVQYSPGIGFATEFGTGVGYTNTRALLGEPSRVTPGMFGGPVDPFSAPYLREQLLSLGTNGSVTVRMDSPILNDPANPFGMDFSIFGNGGFIITNGNFSGGGITDGSQFSQNTGSSRISVSADGVKFFTLDPAQAPVVDTGLPIDGSGDFLTPANPSLQPGDFSGRTLSGLRELYHGSAGGSGYDLAWARNDAGEPVALGSVSFVRIENLTGRAEIDGISTVLPQPGLHGFRETFAQNPDANGWRSLGESSLFGWDSNRMALKVRWDSSKPNSYFARELGDMVTSRDDFAFGFDLEPVQILAGANGEKKGTFQIAVGLMNRREATRTNLLRGTGVDAVRGPRSAVEWNYFPDTGFGTTVAPAVFSARNTPAVSFAFPYDLVPGTIYRVTMIYSASERLLRTSMLSNGVPMKRIDDVKLPPAAEFDFQADLFAIASYNDGGQNPEYAGSILADGWIDNVRLGLPAPLRVAGVGRKPGRLEFHARAGWNYVLQRSTDLQNWTDVASADATASGTMQMMDTSPPSGHAAYRLKARITAE